MDLECTGSILVMFMPENGLMGSVMGVEFILVMMEVNMLGSSSGALSMALVITISGESLILVFGYVWVNSSYIIDLVVTNLCLKID